MLNLESARSELGTKSYNDIQRETAWKWASRAAVSFQDVVDDRENALSAWMCAEEYFHEAVEHAALYEDTSLLGEIHDAVSPFKKKAYELLDSIKTSFSDKKEE